ncbi:hypothetical protein [Celerinatantimonas diazotrophica]|uniref:Uncharacterized protein n=1 Tax=Celerinatantimonas diazotrophica TaxID=412034 RepID=A0A4R1K3V2_9GAMM|nr:hypothetical protein [Celerinatantimonas diazotrophica]TCK58580.1 hypothetical protein EV690_0710 [Celerinatantimonas diazotrophica]CAG9297209.1 hypothetical protein CEDIAZO_02379 [Celerinatantimonas diazotrophica]
MHSCEHDHHHPHYEHDMHGVEHNEIPWEEVVAIHTYKIALAKKTLTYLTIDFTSGEYLEFVDGHDDFEVVIELIETYYPTLLGLKERLAKINHTSVVDLYVKE